MTHKNSLFIIVLLFLLVFILGTQFAIACSCEATPNVLEEYKDSDQVAILRVLSVEKSTQDENYYVDGVKSTKMVVEKVYKGTLKINNEITFAQGGGADCIWTFNEKSVGETFLFYLTNPTENPNVWYGFGCGRSRNIKGATSDLKFLNNINDLLGKTRISGNFECWSENCPSISQRKIKIINENKTVYETITDKDGFYEIYNLPAGLYLIEPEIPAGWKVDNYWLRYSTSFIADDELEEFPDFDSTKQFPIILGDKNHAELNFQFDIDNSIQGKVLAPDGKPMKGVCVYAISADAKEFKYGPSDCTDNEGKFKITELNRKNYVLVINGDEELSATEPIERLFYPGVNERTKATVVSISEGKELKLKNFRVPKLLDTVTLSGKLFYSDGTPVQIHKVQFIADDLNEKVENKPYDYTEKDGSFLLKIFKRQKGKLRAEMIFGERHLDSCPDIRNAVIENDRSPGIITASTRWIEIKADRDLKDIELIFPFQKCKKD